MSYLRLMEFELAVYAPATFILFAQAMRLRSSSLAESRWTFNKVQGICTCLKIMKLASNIGISDEFHERNKSVCFREYVLRWIKNIFRDLLYLKARLLETFRRNESKVARNGRFLTCKTFISDERFPHKMENLSKQLFPLLLTRGNKSEKNRCVRQKAESKTLKKYFWLKCIFITSIRPFALMSIRRKVEIE